MPQRMETSKDLRFFKSKPNMFFSSSWRNIPTLTVHIHISLPCAPAPSPRGSMLEDVKNGLCSPVARRLSQAIVPPDHPPPQCPGLPIPITVLHFSCHLIHGCPTFSIVPLPLDILGFIQHLFTLLSTYSELSTAYSKVASAGDGIPFQPKASLEAMPRARGAENWWLRVNYKDGCNQFLGACVQHWAWATNIVDSTVYFRHSLTHFRESYLGHL